MNAQEVTLGIDFGTSNSAAGVIRGGKAHLIEVEPGETTLPTAFFFDFDRRETLIGHAAGAALIEGREGRYMRALKRVLGTSLMHEKRQILNERLTFVEIIGRFLERLRLAAEAELGVEVRRVLSGRPVHFHESDPARDDKAEADLRLAYEAAGFSEVSFMAEPEAAAIAGGPPERGLGLVVDIGGGTSDFSLYEAGQGGVTILANHGVRIGGTDFDRAVSFERVMPLLGRGGMLRREMGEGLLEAPTAIYADLATWEKIPFLYTPQSKRMVKDMRVLAEAPRPFERLEEVLESELGHDIAFAVEAGKIAANGEAGQGAAELGFIEPGLAAGIDAAALGEILAPFAAQIGEAAAETLRMAGVGPEAVTRVTYVGGSSLLAQVSETMREALPEAEHVFSEVFTAVAEGLAIAADRRD
ncbi:Hsp70 family protein [Pseudoroseicyclus tamaricis]|uniref:Hsp70 family protein n=2 Tax=Pseudoroseicyclus tamaricis TaxID=2705421 RepID=A0A6B2JRL3_9RHOB|nr:Hsp70 family protein [Pseudoroseicyclus tamaricis]NDV00828.1 Hsp70 family protein [Pseudoroseicyclus tamaricis]